MSDPTYAPNVIVALLRVMADLPAIGKDGTAAPSQGGYAYRGIEQITAHARPLFAKHGVVFVPRVVGYEIRDITVAGKPWTDTVEQVEYDVFGPGGVEDRITVGPILAIGRDNSDKGANKCMTQAFKYALLQALCVSDSADDGDGQTHEAEIGEAPQRPLLHPDAVERFVEACVRDGVEVAAVVSVATGTRTTDPNEVYGDEGDALRAALKLLKVDAGGDAGTHPPADAPVERGGEGEGHGTCAESSPPHIPGSGRLAGVDLPADDEVAPPPEDMTKTGRRRQMGAAA